MISFPPESVLWGARSSYEVLVDSESVEVLLATGSVLFCKKDGVRSYYIKHHCALTDDRQSQIKCYKQKTLINLQNNIHF